MPSDDEYRILLGAYVLGALTREEDRLVVDHLLGCDRCGADYLELAQTSDVLGLADGVSLLDGDGPLGGGDAAGRGG
ncbi:zf-HC2 domain-containing protein [Streptomyces sp. NPDC057271]|uniref:zf-HC2 domain-containing protein n=1 Tax=unclassified Streptomyces TaxID=2593676 RepID=UPI00363CF020